MTDLAHRLAGRIREEGPVPYSVFVEAALYDPERGFYASQGSAGRRGDFITSAEVGPLFGAVLARALDEWWIALGSPAPFRVVEAGAGRGTLARAVLAAAPACLEALDYVLVERSERLRGDHPTARPFRSLADLPADVAPGVVLANELLDNLAFDLVERRGGHWHEVRVDIDGAAGFTEVLGPVIALDWAPVDVAEGARLPVQRAAAQWVAAALASVAPGRVVIIDYADRTESLALRPWNDWLRTYQGHERGGAPLDTPGSQDVTCEVDIGQLESVRPLAADRSQAEFLQAHGIDELVDEGRRIWRERAHVADLASMRARSRVREAEALLDPEGLGAFRVVEWDVPAP